MISRKEVKVEVRVLNLRKNELRQLPRIYEVVAGDVASITPICWISGNVVGDPKGSRWLVAQKDDTLVLIDPRTISRGICKYKGPYIIWCDDVFTWEIKHAIVR